MTVSIRVSMIIQGYHPRVGGAERQLAALAPLLQARGVEVNVLTRRYPGLKPFEIINDVPVYRLPIPGPTPVGSMIFILAAMQLLRRLQPHLIHAHELLSPTMTAVMAKRWFNIPVVAKVLRGGELGDVMKLKRNALSARRLKSYRDQVDRFIVISQEIDTELAEIGVLPAQRAFIPNGVDTTRFSPLSPAAKRALRNSLGLPDVPTAIFTGRLSPEKRVDSLIHLWPTVQTVQPGALLLIVGTGSEAVSLQRAAGAGVQFIGQVEDVAPYLQAADLFVLPSATEGLSNALLEALSTGLAAIATAVGGAPDVIEHGKTGWLIPPDYPSALQEAILKLLADPGQQAILGRAGREQIISNYALPATADRLRTLYDQLLQPQTDPFLKQALK